MPADTPPDERFRRFGRLFLGLAFCLALFGLCCGAIASADTWWHLATGRWIVQHGAVPRTDPFSFSAAGKPWVAHEYLTDVLFFLLHRYGGFVALAVANALVLSVAFATIASAAHAPRWVAYSAAVFGAFAAQPAFAIRPQSFSMAFGAAFIWIIRKSLRGHNPRWLIALPCLMLLWVQLHAGYVLGIGLIVMLLFGEAIDWLAKRSDSSPGEWLPLLYAGAGCVAVVPLNPNGLTMLTFPFFVMRLKITHQLTEWLPANLHDPHLRPFIVLAIITLLAMLLSKAKYRPGWFFLYAALLAAALKSARNIPIFCLIAALLLAEHLWVPESLVVRITAVMRMVISACILGLAGYFCAQAAANGLAFQTLAEKNLYPRDAVNYISAHQLSPNVLNDYTFGGYMIWRLYPEYQVYVDGRADLYGDEFLDRYIEIYDGESDPRPFLDQNRINTVILAPSSRLSTLLRMLSLNGDWQLDFEDLHAVVFVRRNSLR